MTGFGVDPEALRAAAGAAREAAGVVRKLELGRVAELAAASPGTESPGSVGELGPHWADDDTERAVRDLVRDLGATEEHPARNAFPHPAGG